MIYPWQKTAWQSMAQHRDRQPNAWLFYGGYHNTDRLDFVQEYAKSVLCENPIVDSYLPCNTCQACYLFTQHNHPDFYHIITSDKTELIKIESIRQVSEKIQTTGYLSGWKVVLISPAETMNMSASNALLKVLEEPPSKTIFLLVSHVKDRLLPTIISRCRKFAVPKPTHQESLTYLSSLSYTQDHIHLQLAFNSGSPFFEDNFPFDVYQDFLNIMLQPRLLSSLDFAKCYESKIKSLDYFFDWVYKWLADLILVEHGYAVKFNLAYKAPIEGIKDKYGVDDLFSLLNLVKKQARHKRHPLNIKLQIESVILEYLLLSIR